MKKGVVFVVLAIVVIGSCAAQSANDAQRIVGTWTTDDDGTTYVFNANGTGTCTSGTNWSDPGKTLNIFWGFSPNGEIFIAYNSSRGSYSKYSLSPDGRRMSIGTNMYQKK